MIGFSTWCQAGIDSPYFCCAVCAPCFLDVVVQAKEAKKREREAKRMEKERKVRIPCLIQLARGPFTDLPLRPRNSRATGSRKGRAPEKARRYKSEAGANL